MAAESESETTPSLEPPSLFRRRKPKADPVEAPAAAADAAPDPEVVAPQAPPRATVAPVTRATPVPPVEAEPTSATFADAGTDVAVDDVHASAEVEHDDPAATTLPVSSLDRSRGVPPKVLQLLRDLPSAIRSHASRTAPGTTPGTAPGTDASRSGRSLPAGLGAAAAGLLTGVSLLVLMWAGFRGCELARGNESCGTGPGMILLVVIFVLTVLVGRVLLHLLKVPEPGMTSFLAVGLTCLVAVVVLSGLFDSVAILIVLPLLSAAAFYASAWVATLQLDSSG